MNRTRRLVSAAAVAATALAVGGGVTAADAHPGPAVPQVPAVPPGLVQPASAPSGTPSLCVAVPAPLPSLCL